MIICGIKLTHDGAVALIDNGKLVFSYEMEKLENRPRYSDFCITLDRVRAICSEHGYDFEDIDRLVIDGWDNWNAANINSTKAKKEYALEIQLDAQHRARILEIADYGHLVKKEENILAAGFFKSENQELTYKSYKHVTGHILGAYCTSPFSKKLEDSYILVWDGGMPPQLFYYESKENVMRNMGYLFPFTGYMYINFAHAFEPFCLYEKHLTIAGKAMAYMAMGTVDATILDRYRAIFSELTSMIERVEPDMDMIAILTEEFIQQAKKFRAAGNLRHQDMLTTFQEFIQELLLQKLEEKIDPSLCTNLCFVGGSALNIKWNSKIRDSGLFRSMWVPPFTNDSGSALGAACCEMVMSDGIKYLDWNVYSGPKIENTSFAGSGYERCQCTLEELAYLLHNCNQPVVFLNGAAELGPRALGNRSILAAAIEPGMKKLLNDVKGREDYRPVAPICMEDHAREIFSPGSPDPYMLYEHRVRPSWKDKVPAICHLDGTARLQTVNKNENAAIYELLTHYRRIAGVPLLCNTSANFNGKGFFPDVSSAMAWGKLDLIWSEGELFYRNKSFFEIESLKKDILAIPS